jgi:hypothetical protein
MTVAALAKAESLAQFARASGSPLDTFALVLTEPEAYELLDYLASGGMGRYENHALLIADIDEAKRQKNPWGVLGWFQLEGLSIWPASSLH